MAQQFGHLFHGIPQWVSIGARYHVRIRSDREGHRLTQSGIAEALLKNVELYHQNQRWYAWLVVIMPDHIHAILSFPADLVMSRVVGDWKRYQHRMLHVTWQENFFDHRIRNRDEYLEKALYIRMNPVKAGLCKMPEEWPWVMEAPESCVF